jgi:hypothetical protein
MLVLAAGHHTTAYYVICNLADRATWLSLKRTQQLGRLELGLTSCGIAPQWRPLDLSQQFMVLAQALKAQQAQKGAWRDGDDSWRDSLGRLLLSLPQLMMSAQPQARFSEHAALLVGGKRSVHETGVQNCLKVHEASA